MNLKKKNGKTEEERKLKKDREIGKRKYRMVPKSPKTE